MFFEGAIQDIEFMNFVDIVAINDLTDASTWRIYSNMTLFLGNSKEKFMRKIIL